MSQKAGRNDACPCGSGLKFKRCCAANERAVSDKPGATPEVPQVPGPAPDPVKAVRPTSGPAAISESQAFAFAGQLGDIAMAGWRAWHELGERAQQELERELLETLGPGAGRPGPQALQWLLETALFTGAAEGPLSLRGRLHARVRPHLRQGELRELHEQLCAQPLAAWQTRASQGGGAAIRPATASGAMPWMSCQGVVAHPLARLSAPGRESGPRIMVGMSLVWRGSRLLWVVGEVEPRVAERGELTLLAALLEQREPRAQPGAPSLASAIYRPSAQDLLEDILRELFGRIRRGVRASALEQLCGLASEAALEAFGSELEEAYRCVVLDLFSHLEDLPEVLPLARLRKLFRCEPEAAAQHLRALRRQPASCLLLDAEVQGALEVSAASTMGQLLERAAQSPASIASIRAQEAWQVYVREQRLAWMMGVQPDGRLESSALLVDRLASVRAMADGRLMSWPLGRLPMPGASLGRLQRSLERVAPGVAAGTEPCLGQLPGSDGDLGALSGIGQSTVEDVRLGLAQLLWDWRRRWVREPVQELWQAEGPGEGDGEGVQLRLF